MKFIDGKEIAAKKLLALKDKIVEQDIEPALAVVLVGDDPASHLYVKLKEKAAKQIGVELRKYTFDADASEDMICEAIEFLNKDSDTDGVIVQLPLPDHLDADVIVSAIDPSKDVDGFHGVNQEKFLEGESALYPVFPNAIMSLIRSEVQDFTGKKSVVIGKSDVFDRVMTHALKSVGAEAQFMSCENINNDVVHSSDIIVTACGKPSILSCDAIRDNTIVIDGGISKVDEKTVGDVDLSDNDERKIIISPVPGGVGPVTIACLLENVVELAKK